MKRIKNMVDVAKHPDLIQRMIELHEDFIIELAKITPQGTPLTEKEQKRFDELYQMHQLNGLMSKGFPVAEYSALTFKHNPAQLAAMIKQERARRR